MASVSCIIYFINVPLVLYYIYYTKSGWWWWIFTDTGIVPPLIYALLASSRETVIGPGSVDSLLLSSMIQTLKVPIDDYTQLVFTVTFFAGIFQVAFGLFR